MGQDRRRISWDEALNLLEGGTIVQAMQTHSLEVTLVDAQGWSYIAREPEIDTVLRAIQGLDREFRERISVRTE